MSDLKINCPICNQEFPAYDQRGFRNAGFTSHHKKCLERFQQSNEPQKHDQHTSRASRFALAVRRRLLPARPGSSANHSQEGQNRISPQSPLPGSSSSSSSSSPSKQTDISPDMTPVVPSQAAHATRYFYPRQRHTWNHWTQRRKSRRSTLEGDSASIIAPPSGIVRSHRSLPVMDTADNDTSAFPLLTAMTTVDSTPALLIPQSASPPLSNHAASPMMPDGSTFSFTSMLTTLPVESAPLIPTATISTFSSSNNSSINDRNSIDVGYQRPAYNSMESIPTDWMHPQYSGTDDRSLYQEQPHNQHHVSYVPVHTQQHETIPIDSTIYHYDNSNVTFPAATTSTSSTDTLPAPLQAPEHWQGNDHEPIYYCGYCQPQHGRHDPSCSLMQFIMMDIIGGHDGPSSSSG